MKKKKIIITCTILIVVLLIIGVCTSYVDTKLLDKGIESKYTLKFVSKDKKEITYLGYKVRRVIRESIDEPFTSSYVLHGSWFTDLNNVISYDVVITE